MTPVVEAVELYRFLHAGDEETKALRGVSLVVAAGEVLAVTGPSGSGKSTLLACLAGLDDPDGGTVSVTGERVSRRPEAQRARLRARRIGFLAQTGNLVDHLSVVDNVRLARQLVPRRRDSTVAALLERVGLDARGRAYPPQLSGGEQARAGLAVALANDPAVLLADEPTGELDRANEAAVLELLHERADAGGAVIVVTHSTAVAAAADRVIHLKDGRVVP